MDCRSLPTLLHNETPRLWYNIRKRWMTVDEKLAHMGLPSNAEFAEQLQVPVIKGQLMDQGHALVGNGMHMPNIAMIIFSVLACVELRECDVMKTPTRPHEIPMNLIHEFNRLAKPFKDTNVEFMAYILGKIRDSSAGQKLRATHLYVPEQDSTATEVWQTSEDGPKVLATQEKTGTVTIGWIHLHPNFDAFLSSVDQHTQMWFQSFQPMALAIVIDGRTDVPSFFHLTQHGLAYVRQCKGIGFHEHKCVEPLVESVDVAILHEKSLDTVEAGLHPVFVQHMFLFIHALPRCRRQDGISGARESRWRLCQRIG